MFVQDSIQSKTQIFFLLSLNKLKSYKLFLGFLVFLDNESGFGHSYRLMSQYEKFHLKSLKSICILRKSTFERLRYLNHLSEFELEKQFNHNEISKLLPPLPKAQIKTLKARLDLACKHFEESCETKR